MVSGSDLVRVALEGCEPLGADFVASRSPEEPEPEVSEPVIEEPDEPEVEEPVRTETVVVVEEPEQEEIEDCPWSQYGNEVDVSNRRITVNGEEFDVNGAQDRRAFTQLLYVCQEGENAVTTFERWRKKLRRRNALYATIILSMYGAFASSGIRVQRDALEGFLESPN